MMRMRARWETVAALANEDVPLAVELRDGDPVSELSQAGETATSGAAVVMGV
jgi:hypothetical protein